MNRETTFPVSLVYTETSGYVSDGVKEGIEALSE